MKSIQQTQKKRNIATRFFDAIRKPVNSQLSGRKARDAAGIGRIAIEEAGNSLSTEQAYSRFVETICKSMEGKRAIKNGKGDFFRSFYSAFKKHAHLAQDRKGFDTIARSLQYGEWAHSNSAYLAIDVAGRLGLPASLVIYDGDFYAKLGDGTCTGPIYLLNNQKFDDAVHMSKNAVEISGENLDFMGYFMRGLFKAHNGDNSAAVPDLRECIRLAPKFAEPYADLGAILGKLKQYGESTQILEKALEFDPHSYNAKVCIAGNYLEMENYADALAWFKRTNSEHGGSIYLDFKIAFCHCKLGNYDETIKTCSKYIKGSAEQIAGLEYFKAPMMEKLRAERDIKYFVSEFYYLRALAYFGKGETKMAKKDNDKALDARPGNPPFLELKSEMEHAV